jgi:NAD(P)-dependent dehydrogenase (short-subunit alcohol dehydrogenase family)
LLDRSASPAAFTQKDIEMTIEKATDAKPPVWFITGCSTGFGHELAKQALERGFRVVATARKPKEIKSLQALGEALTLKLDVTDAKQIDAAVEAAEDKFGQIDVLVNNAGIGYFAGIEEGEDDQIRRLFDINVFGLCRVTRTVLPVMRRKRRGLIVNLSSLAGIRGMAALGYYNATKFAVEGLSEALRDEVAPLGLKVMVVEPSGFRTDWAGRSAEESQGKISDYVATADAGRKRLRDVSGKQPGDPVRAAKAIIEAAQLAEPPHHLLLGADAFEGAMKKVEELRQEFAAGEAVARAADFPAARQDHAA